MEQLLEYCRNSSEHARNEGLHVNNNPDKKKNWEEQKYQAYDQAFREIIKDSEDKLKTAAEQGFRRAEIFKYKTTDDVKFNGIFVSDILRKGDVMQRLRSHFQGFDVRLDRVTKNKDVISVSWYPYRKIREKNSFRRNTQNESCD